MNRRDFFGAFLSGLIAALVLPFEDFVRWWKGLGARDVVQFRKVLTVSDPITMPGFWIGQPLRRSRDEVWLVNDRVLRVESIDYDRGIITVSA